MAHLSFFSLCARKPHPILRCHGRVALGALSKPRSIAAAKASQNRSSELGADHTNKIRSAHELFRLTAGRGSMQVNGA